MSKREEIKAFITRTVDELTAMMRSAAQEAVDKAFADDGEDGEPAPAKPRKTLRSARAVRALPAATSGGADAGTVLAAVKANPGGSSSDIARYLGKSPNGIRPALNELVAVGKVKKSGNGRGTTYTAGR